MVTVVVVRLVVPSAEVVVTVVVVVVAAKSAQDPRAAIVIKRVFMVILSSFVLFVSSLILIYNRNPFFTSGKKINFSERGSKRKAEAHDRCLGPGSAFHFSGSMRRRLQLRQIRSWGPRRVLFSERHFP